MPTLVKVNDLSGPRYPAPDMISLLGTVSEDVATLLAPRESA